MFCTTSDTFERTLQTILLPIADEMIISYLLLLSSWKSLALSLDSDQLAASKRYYAISRCTALNILDYEWHWTAQPALRKIFLPLEAQY